MLGESRRQSACPAASKAPFRTMAATSYCSNFVLKNVSETLPRHVPPCFQGCPESPHIDTSLCIRVAIWKWKLYRSKTQAGLRVNRTGPFASDACARLRTIWKARSLSKTLVETSGISLMVCDYRLFANQTKRWYRPRKFL